MKSGFSTGKEVGTFCAYWDIIRKLEGTESGNRNLRRTQKTNGTPMNTFIVIILARTYLQENQVFSNSSNFLEFVKTRIQRQTPTLPPLGPLSYPLLSPLNYTNPPPLSQIKSTTTFVPHLLTTRGLKKRLVGGGVTGGHGVTFWVWWNNSREIEHVVYEAHEVPTRTNSHRKQARFGGIRFHWLLCRLDLKTSLFDMVIQMSQ